MPPVDVLNVASEPSQSSEAGRVSVTVVRSRNPVPVIVNLASQEYFKAADRKALKPRVIECQFEDWKNGQYKIISFFAKRARGLMARYAVTQRISQPADLLGFDLDGYRHAAEASTPERLGFRRRLAD